MVVLLVALVWLSVIAMVLAACRSAAMGDRALDERRRRMAPPRLVATEIRIAHPTARRHAGGRV